MQIGQRTATDAAGSVDLQSRAMQQIRASSGGHKMTELHVLQDRLRTGDAIPTDKVQLAFVDDGAVAVITLNDPALGNPMSPEMGDGFSAAVDQLKGLSELRVVIVRGAGHHFSVGGHRDMLTKLS